MSRYSKPWVVTLPRLAKLYLARARRVGWSATETAHAITEGFATVAMGRGFFPADTVNVSGDFESVVAWLQLYGCKPREMVLNVI